VPGPDSKDYEVKISTGRKGFRPALPLYQRKFHGKMKNEKTERFDEIGISPRNGVVDEVEEEAEGVSLAPW